MRRLGISYAKSINSLYGKSGHLFEGRFRSKRIDTDEYLLDLMRYIHLNPVAAHLVKRPENWEFSSYLDYLRDPKDRASPPRPLHVHIDTLLSYFSDREDFKRFHDSFVEERFKRFRDSVWEDRH